jgi:hypothetical protein
MRHHGICNLEFNPTSRNLVFTSSVVAPPMLLNLTYWCASATERASPQHCRPQWSWTERRWIKFLGSILRNCSIASPNLSSLGEHRLLSSTTRRRPDWAASSQLHCLQRRGSIIVLFSLIMSYTSNLVICIGMIMVDLLQYLIYIIVIDLSSIFDSTAVSIYNSLLIFMIYFCIRIKL